MCMCVLCQKSCIYLRISLVRSHFGTVKFIFEVYFTEWVIVYQYDDLAAEL
jgi:hypothetical protein